jgi:polysaccharide deacetylase family protein (PEP-CTERM system associated)
MSIKNALTIDVEDYFQVSAFENTIDRNDWDSIEHRVAANLDKIIDILSDAGVHATFFVLGWVAERYPGLVDKIVQGGHELASHGYGHQRVSDLSPDQFREDLKKSKVILEDISGKTVKGYRAPSYSIGRENLWALKVLAESGFQYSSSIYPIQHDHYGFQEAPRFSFRDEVTGLIEIPITTVKLFKRLRPAGGGGFFRFYPYALSRWAIQRVNTEDQEPAVFYFHPWELDPSQPRISNISLKTRFRHYLNLDKTEGRLKRLLKDIEWGTMQEVFVENKNPPTHRLVGNF